MKTAYTVKELIEILNTLPSTASVEIFGYEGVDIFYVPEGNTVCLEHP